MYGCTTGDAFIRGLSINSEMSAIRQHLGVCPQFSILFPLLTAREHLQLFATLKGVPSERLDEEVEGMLRDVQMTNQADMLVDQLSLGHKRKLSVGMALIGGSEIVFLDEPSSGQ